LYSWASTVIRIEDRYFIICKQPDNGLLTKKFLI
jgi:hypothetical protein